MIINSKEEALFKKIKNAMSVPPADLSFFSILEEMSENEREYLSLSLKYILTKNEIFNRHCKIIN